MTTFRVHYHTSNDTRPTTKEVEAESPDDAVAKVRSTYEGVTVFISKTKVVRNV